MGRKRKKATGLYEKIKQNTFYTYNEKERNYLLSSIDSKEKKINYIVSEDLFNKILKKILEYMNIGGKITIQEATEILFNDIYCIYKTKVSTVRIPLLVMNILVSEGFLYSDNNYDYILKNCQLDINFFKK